MEAQLAGDYPVQFSVDYPHRDLNRLTTAFRIVVAIPILVVLGALGAHHGSGALFLAPLLLIVVRQKYPRWWYDWNLQLTRFTNRACVYLALMDDAYPSTDEEQSVSLQLRYPDAKQELNRWLPLVKWLLAIPHLIVLAFLALAAIVCVIISWFAILFTGRYPRSLFRFVEGVLRWGNRVNAYAFILVTDQYPPFRLNPKPPLQLRRSLATPTKRACRLCRRGRLMHCVQARELRLAASLGEVLVVR